MLGVVWLGLSLSFGIHTQTNHLANIYTRLLDNWRAQENKLKTYLDVLFIDNHNNSLYGKDHKLYCSSTQDVYKSTPQDYFDRQSEPLHHSIFYITTPSSSIRGYHLLQHLTTLRHPSWNNIYFNT